VATTGLAFAARAFLGDGRPPERPTASVSPQISPLPPVTGRIVETVPLEGANSIAYGAGSIWVASLGYGSPDRLLRFDPGTGEKLAEITVQGVTSWGVGGGGIAFGAGGVWVVGSGGGQAVAQRIHPAVNEVVQTVTFGNGHPAEVAVDDSTVWVTLFPGAALDHTEVVKLDSATGSVTARISLETPYAREVSAAEGAVWVLEREVHRSTVGRGVLVRVDPDTERIVRAIERGNVGALDMGGGALWVANLTWRDELDGEFSLIRVDPVTRQVLDEEVALDPYRVFNMIDAAFGAVWFFGTAPDGSGTVVARLDPATAEVEPVVTLPWELSPIDMAVTPDSLWVVNYEGSITRMDLTNG
jgi:DNA-binding beta-propeller fold protein YncE